MSKIKLLYEAKNVGGKLIPEYGDELIFKTSAGDFGFNDSFTVGKSYKVEDTTIYQASGESVLRVTDDIGRGMIFTIKPDINGRSFETYFDWHPFDYDVTSSMFDSLNESNDYQPKLNLRFVNGISDVRELDRVLQTLSVTYPNLQWTSNRPIQTHNIIEENPEDFEYEPIQYLTIGFFRESPNKLTYTSGPYDDLEYSDSEHYGYNWVDGYEWLKNNHTDFDVTSDLFDSLNEGWAYLESKRYTQKFNIGDRVIMNGTVGTKSLNNELGTVLKYKLTGGGTGHPHRVYLILFDNWNEKKGNFLMFPFQADQNREFVDPRCGDGGCWYTTSDNLEPAPDSSELFDGLNETKGDYGFLRNSDLVGVQFYNPAEWVDTGCLYTIIEQLTTGHLKYDDYNVEPHIRVHWENNKIPNLSYNDQTTLLRLSEFIQDLSTGYFVIMSDDNTDFFDSLNESHKERFNETYIPNLNLKFDPLIETKGQLNKVLITLQLTYPNLVWINNGLVSEYNPFDGELDKYEVIEGLNITEYDGSFRGGRMTYNCLVDDGEDDNRNYIDGWEWVQKHNSDTNQIFNSLYDN